MLAFAVWALLGRSSKNGLLEQITTSIALSAVLLLSFPQVTLAQSVETDLAPSSEIEHQNENLISEPLFPRDVPGNKLNTLKNYLQAKNSPLADYVEILMLQRNWKIVLAISQAESNMCKRELGHNCWGIGGGNHRKYPSYNEAIVDANALLQKYFDRGHTGPESIMPVYVGWNNRTWIIATNNVLDDIQELGL